MPYDKDGIGYQKTDTSKEAKGFPDKRATIRNSALKTLRENPEGLTTEEVVYLMYGEIDLGEFMIKRSAVQPRLTELQNSGLIKDSGERRKSKNTGKNIIVWEPTEEDDHVYAITF